MADSNAHTVGVVGDSLWDIYLSKKAIDTDHPKESSFSKSNFLLANSRRQGPGGGALNSSFLLKKLNTTPLLLSSVGNDIYGREIVKELRTSNVCLKYVQMLENTSTSLLVKLENRLTKNPSNLGGIFHGVKFPVDHKGFEEWLDSCDTVMIFPSGHSSRDVSMFLTSLKIRRKNVIYVPSPLVLTDTSHLLKDILLKVSTLSINRNEFYQIYCSLFNKTCANGYSIPSEDTIQSLVDEIEIDRLIITLDKNGVVLSSNGEIHYFENKECNAVVSSAGAGDAFIATFVAYELHGFCESESVAAGQNNAIRVITSNSTYANAFSAETLQELKQFVY